MSIEVCVLIFESSSRTTQSCRDPFIHTSEYTDSGTRQCHAYHFKELYTRNNLAITLAKELAPLLQVPGGIHFPNPLDGIGNYRAPTFVILLPFPY